MHKRGLCRYAMSVCVCVCVCVCLSVTFVSCVKTNKRIIIIFSPSGSHTILVFSYQTGWGYSDGNPHNGGIECRYVGMLPVEHHVFLRKVRFLLRFKNSDNLICSLFLDNASIVK